MDDTEENHKLRKRLKLESFLFTAKKWQCYSALLNSTPPRQEEGRLRGINDWCWNGVLLLWKTLP